MSDFNNHSGLGNDEAMLEALLFVASQPVAKSQLAEALEVNIQTIDKIIHRLEMSFSQTNRGLRIQHHGGKLQLITAPEYAGVIEKFLGLDATTKLSRAGLEALAIIAYRQPITRPAIDAVRGVNSDGVLRSLLNKGLVEEVGRTDGPGRPILYMTSMDFLSYFGLTSLEELPPLEPITENINNNHILKD